MSHQTLYELLSKAGRERFRAEDAWAWVCDYNVEDGWVVYDVERWNGDTWVIDSWKLGFEYSEVPVGVTLDDGDPEKVAPVVEYRTAEQTRIMSGRLIEATVTDDGHRVYAVQVIEAGLSLNNVMYDAQVLEAAAGLYDGAKAYDRHRSLEELNSGTIAGLVGHYRNPTWSGTGIVAELHLLPSEVHAREALDASIAAQTEGLAPIVGISHDVIVDMATVTIDGQTFEQARHIIEVLSSDIVAAPAAGGRAERIVASRERPARTPTRNKENSDMNLQELLAALAQESDPEKRAELLEENGDTITAAGFTADAVDELAPYAAAGDDTDTDPVEEPVLVGAGAQETRRRNGETTARRYTLRSLEGRGLIRLALDDVGIEEGDYRKAVEAALPAEFTEAELVAAVKPFAKAQETIGKVGTLKVGKVQVRQEETDKLSDRMDATMGIQGASAEPFHSFREMFAAFNPEVRYDVLESADFPYMVLRECYQGMPRLGEAPQYGAGGRVSEAITTSTFSEIIGTSINKRLVADYRRPMLADWNLAVSEKGDISNFQTQERARYGGYGTLPTVAENDPYQPLTTPGDEQATFTISKRGGTESLTIETIANDRLGALRDIPKKLGMAARQTIHRFVWNLIVTNPTMTYDSTALFHGDHGNLGSTALSHATLLAARIAMLEQTAYGDTSDNLEVTPKVLVVPPELIDTGFRLTTSGVAIPASAEVSDMPNIHGDMVSVPLSYLTDTNNWFVLGDKNEVPMIEIGFFKGREEPELFVQDQATVGSVFTSDAITYKVRHIYGGTVLDHRGMYGAIVT